MNGLHDRDFCFNWVVPDSMLWDIFGIVGRTYVRTFPLILCMN